MTNPPATETGARGGPPARSPFPPIRTVTLGAPFDWLALGWRDLRGAPAASLFYGAAFALMGLLIHLGPFWPDLKFYGRLFFKPWMQERGARLLWVTMLLTLSQIANALGFLREWLNQIKKR